MNFPIKPTMKMDSSATYGISNFICVFVFFVFFVCFQYPYSHQLREAWLMVVALIPDLDAS